MNEEHRLARRFEENRGRLKKVAFRMLGSEAEAEDAVQEAWLRLSRSDGDVIDNLSGWLTTVVGRICLDTLRSRKGRREEPLDIEELSELPDSGAADPERDAILAESIGPALVMVLDTLSPPERVAFVLHDMFGMPFEEIAPIIDRSATASRQLASRARRRLHGSVQDAPSLEGRTERRLVDAFLAAARGGDLQTLLSVLHPECALRADDFASVMGAPKQAVGNAEVAAFFNGRAAEARRAIVDGKAGAAWVRGGKVLVAFGFIIAEGKILDIELIADRESLRKIDLVLLD
jgi:RNA polymerase sigma factor (sigma-70 family)